jgi:type II secretory ATPase GspE/PulE/Tfp pilus assembly ATPase PilB-like protein
MRTLLQNGSQKVLEGLTTAEEVLRVTQDGEHAESQLPAL